MARGRAVVKRHEAGGGRLVSLDALRGFDMFWIIGADWLAHSIGKISDHPVVRLVSSQLEHKDWEGFAFYDLIFPLFVFIVGVSTVFSMEKNMAEGGRAAAVRRILRRGLLLYLLGILYYGGLSGSVNDIRWLGVLQRISICYVAAALAFCFLGVRWLVALAVALLAGYWALMTFVPVPGVPGHSFAEGSNLANYIDRTWLPGRRYDGDHDPEGILSTLPAIASCLLGVLAGIFLRRGRGTTSRKALCLAAAGAAGVASGFLWGTQFPVIKKIWTSSYVLVAGGYSCLLLAFFLWVVDGLGWRRWAMPFVWIGTNAITIYLAWNIVDFGRLSRLLVGGDVASHLGRYAEVVQASVAILLSVFALRFLYRRRVFLRL
jgi:predicted acyltransferase